MFLPNDTTTEDVSASTPDFTWTISQADVASLAVEHELFPSTGIMQLYLRVSINDGSTSVPDVEVHAGSGVFVTVPSTSSTSLETGSGDVGTVEFIDRTATELVVRFNLTNDVGTFSLTVHVTDTNGSDHRYVGVVDGLAADTLQPWIYVDPGQGHPDVWNAGKRLLLNETADLQVIIENLGTGPLQLDSPADPLSDTFAVQDIAALVLEVPARDSVTWTVGVTAGSDGGEDSFAWQVGSNDSAHSPGTGHNADVELSASWGKLEVVFVLDASGSMSKTYEGETPSQGERTRWQELYNAVGAFSSVLQTIAVDANGQLSVVIYPDRTQSPIVAETIVVHVDRENITETIFADVIDQLVGGSSLPFSNLVQSGIGMTAITYALGQATGSTDATYGRFDSTPDAKTYNHRFVILMTDGLNNSGPKLEEYYDTGSSADWLVNKRINFRAIPYGPDEYATGDARAELATIAQDQTDETVGILGDLVDPADTSGQLLVADQLINKFKKALASSLNLQFDADPAVDIPGMSAFVHDAFVTPYDRYVSFSVGWTSAGQAAPSLRMVAAAATARILDIELIRPDGHVYTLEELWQLEHVRVATAANNIAITLTSEFLGNRQDPANLNMGAWKLKIINKTEAPRRIVYHVLVQSGLRLALNYESGRAWAGEDLDVEARLTLFGRPLTGASVKLAVQTPDHSAVNWLADQTMDGHAQAAWDALMQSDGDYTGVSAKQAALAAQGIRFDASASTNSIMMHDTNGDGVYRATIPNTAVQGSYGLYVEASGSTPTGVSYSRERATSVLLVPRPDPDYSIFGMDYSMLGGGQVQATVSYKPLDAAGNVILFDPAHSNRVVFHVDGATWTGPMTTKWDGVYTQTMTFAEGQRPNLDIAVDGRIVTLDFPVPSVPELAWACQAVVCLGREAKPGANRHTDPNAAEGNPYEGRHDFVSLGGGGILYVMPSRLCPHMRSITVVVEPDADLRAYKVEVLTAPRFHRCWVEVGRSPGVTQTFDMGELRRRHVFGIRVTDLSNRTRNPDLTPSSTPGVSIRGVGFEPGRRWW
jgi:hypothetical protein